MIQCRKKVCCEFVKRYLQNVPLSSRAVRCHDLVRTTPDDLVLIPIETGHGSHDCVLEVRWGAVAQSVQYLQAHTCRKRTQSFYNLDDLVLRGLFA